MKIARATLNGMVVVDSVEMAVSLVDRMRGLIGRSSLGPKKGMFLMPCNSIHTFLMKFNIDAIFLGQSLQVVRIVRNIPPRRMVLGGTIAWSVLEIQSGWLAESTLKIGDRLAIEQG
jgi:uncharacterized protein